MLKNYILLLVFLSSCLFCHAENIEYRIIPLSMAGDTFDLTSNRPMTTNSRGQTIGFFYDEKTGKIWNFYDPNTGALLKLPRDPRVITEEGNVAGCLDNWGYLWHFKSRKTEYFETPGCKCDVTALNARDEILFDKVFRWGYERAGLFTAEKKVIMFDPKPCSEDRNICWKGYAVNDFS